MKAQQEQLSDVLSEFARTMLTNFPIQAILDHLVGRIVEILPITGAGVTLISPGASPRYVAASDEAALRYEKVQTELGEGPCLLAYHSGEAVSIPNLEAESRFPQFAPHALAAGLGAVFTFPLRHGDHQLGALDLYRGSPGMLSSESMKAAQTLADVVAAYLLNAEARQHLQDVSDQSRHAALHDALTGLPNRLLLLDRLTHALLRSRRTGKASALLYIDLDGFKGVNDTYGHGVGDNLLVGVARRLEQLVRPHDTLARLAGDEFVVLCEDLDTAARAGAIGSRLDLALRRPFLVNGIEINVGASIGIAFADTGDHPDNVDRSAERLLHDADMAMYAAKRARGHQQQLPALHRSDRLFDDLENDLHRALERREFHLEYQPIVATSGGRVCGFEALLRWDHPVHGTIPPNTVIPIAEKSGLIVDIGRWVLQQAWTDRHRWQRSYGDDLSMSVNVSTHQLMSAAFADSVAAVLSGSDGYPELLTLELTESVFVQDSDRALLVLNDLKDLGVTLALDDFGTGYSSLGYLRRFPVDIVKIDRTFIADLGSDSASEIIAGAVIRLAHDLRMTVVAEGVETAGQHHEIDRLGCDCCQGYYFAKPMTAERIESMLGDRDQGRLRPLPARTSTAIDFPHGGSGRLGDRTTVTLSGAERGQIF